MVGARFQWDKLLCWGVGIYALMALVWRFSVLYDLGNGLLPILGRLVILIIAATLAGRSLRLTKAADILPYSIGWTLISMLLDTVLVLPTTGSSMYADVNLWIGYGLILTVPLLSPHTRQKPEPVQIT